MYTDKLSALGIDMDNGAIEDVERSSVQGTLIDVILYVLKSEGRNTDVIELVKTAFESLGDSENQSAIDAFNRAAVQDVAGPTAAFEVQALSAEDNGDVGRIDNPPVRFRDLCVDQASQATTIKDIFSLNTTSEHFSIQYRISSGTLEKDFADRTTRVIIEKTAPFYAKNVRQVNQR
ncbi:hypothetical protein BJV74DRAFT_855266 [Russula compacta]|nr:hypothetical protein BJV74DRAFT_855266 [Russula compacta]